MYNGIVKLIIEDRCYNTKVYYVDLEDEPFEFTHKPRGWFVKLGFKAPIEYIDGGYYRLQINFVKFLKMAVAPPRERAALARSAITMSMNGLKKRANFGLLRNG